MNGREETLRSFIRRALRKRTAYRGQVLVLAVIIILFFIFAVTALIDVYHLEEARNWGYRVAQEAAAAGASWSDTRWEIYQPTVDPLTPTPGPGDCIDSVQVQLNKDEAMSATETLLQSEMFTRGFKIPHVDYDYDIEILPDVGGGTVVAPRYPTVRVRLGSDRGTWSASNPAVGVYISFPVSTFFMSIVGRGTVWIHVFAAAEVAEPAVCPP
jgi:hypothetical protein